MRSSAAATGLERRLTLGPVPGHQPGDPALGDPVGPGHLPLAAALGDNSSDDQTCLRHPPTAVAGVFLCLETRHSHVLRLGTRSSTRFRICATPPPRSSTTANAPKANAITPPSSAWPAAAATSSSPCSAPASPTSQPARHQNSPTRPDRLDKEHGDTPRHPEAHNAAGVSGISRPYRP